MKFTTLATAFLSTTIALASPVAEAEAPKENDVSVEEVLQLVAALATTGLALGEGEVTTKALCDFACENGPEHAAPFCKLLPVTQQADICTTIFDGLQTPDGQAGCHQFCTTLDEIVKKNVHVDITP